MSGERIIPRADLDKIESGLTGLQMEILEVAQDVRVVDHNIQAIQQEVVGTQQKLDDLTKEFREFIKKDHMYKELHLAETRIVKIRQEIEKNYGHYDEVRRRVTGILQAVDARLVKKETIENTSEEYMLAAPRYWLAPCLIALAAWLNDNKDLADRAMMEALKRDDEKTSLFFALVTRRGARYKASRAWLDRYFSLQNPHELDREVIILIDGFTNGIFGPEARTEISKRMESWIDELSQKAGFVEEQTKQWKQVLELKIKQLDDQKYPYLKQYSSTWPKLEESLKGAKLHTTVRDFFQGIFSKEDVPHPNMVVAVDAMLDTLVSKFDAEELPLRREEWLQSLVIEAEGDRGLAQQRFQTEKVLENQISFTQLLTNFSMNPEVSQASLSTQKYSIALSKAWIRQAHDDLTVENRMALPQQIDIQIGDWTGTTVNGDNESELAASLAEHIETHKQAALLQTGIRFKHWFRLVGGAVFLMLPFNLPLRIVVASLAVGSFFYSCAMIPQVRKQVLKQYEDLQESHKGELLALLSDVVDWRKEYALEDANAAKVTEFLESIRPGHYEFTNYDVARKIIQT